MENLVTITVKSTHFFLIDIGKGMLLVDSGWPDALGQFTNRLKAYHIEFKQIRYVMMTHHHPDHAGLTQTIKRLSGAKLLIHEKQIPYLPQLTQYFKNDPRFEPVVVGKDDLVSPDRSRLQSIGIRGELVETPGHSDDSISLVLDSGMAFIGDLHPPLEQAGPHLPGEVDENQNSTVLESWKRLIAKGAKTIYPSHAEPFPISLIKIE